MEIMGKIGMVGLSTTQIQCLSELPITNLYKCLEMFVTWTADGLYDFSSLPFHLKAHILPKDLESLKAIPHKWKGLFRRVMLLHVFE